MDKKTFSPAQGSCPVCASSSLNTQEYTDHFSQLIGGDAIELIATYPVVKCESCGFVTSGVEAEIAKDHAVRKHLKVLLPDEIVAIRKKYGLTRQAFSELTGIGVASLARWESGELIQNKSSDMLLKLLAVEENFSALTRQQADEQRVVTHRAKLRTLTGPELEHALLQSGSFKLNSNKQSGICI